MERAGRRVLESFREDPSDHEVIFTVNTTAALHRVAEGFPFSPGSRHPLEWAERARARGYHSLLDAVAFTPMRRFRLDRVDPELRAPLLLLLQDVPTPHGAGGPHRMAGCPIDGFTPSAWGARGGGVGFGGNAHGAAGQPDIRRLIEVLRGRDGVRLAA
jgi:hypothetical protein